MAVTVDFQGESLEFEIPEERVVGDWRGPEGMDAAETTAAVLQALESPRDFPPLRQLLVPGDRVAIAFDPTIPEAGRVLRALVEVLEGAGVDPDGLTIVMSSPSSAEGNPLTSSIGRVVVHDPDDRTQIAYLATTKEGRRVYLNRLLTDADVVVPVGRLGYDPIVGFRGPWSLMFPGLSDRETLRALRDRSRRLSGEGGNDPDPAVLDESLEVSWLLGTQFFLGIVPAERGPFEVVAGRNAAVRERGIEVLQRSWTLKAPSRAELVVAAVGGPDSSGSLEDLAAALETATRLVQHGGKIVVLSRVSGSIGPALQRLKAADDPRAAADVLRRTPG